MTDIVSLNEQQLKIKLFETLCNDFVFRTEVCGTHIHGEKVRIDYLAWPKQHLINNGFPKVVIGIEVKAPGMGSVSKGHDLIAQAVTYKYSTFVDNICPELIFIYPGFDSFFGYHGKEVVCSVSSICQHLNIGCVSTLLRGWEMHFAGGLFYSSMTGKGKIANVGTKNYVGNASVARSLVGQNA